MGDDNYVKELRAGVVGAKLPTLIDLNPRTDRNPDNRVETPSSINYSAEEPTGRSAAPRQKTPEEIASDISFRIRKLHSDGRKIDEIYEVLESDGYPYSAIEPVLMDYLSKNRPASSVRPPQAQAVSPAVRQPVQPKPQFQFNPQQSTPQRQFTPFPIRQQAPQKPGPFPGLVMGSVSPKPATQGSSMEVVEIRSPDRSFDQRVEEVPTNFPKPSPESGTGQAQAGTENEFAPLFVRVGKYKETLETLNDLENYLKAMARLFALVEELEKIRAVNIEVLDKMHKKALAASEKLSAGLLKPRGMQLEGTRESDVELSKLGDVIGDLSKELTMLKGEVDKINRME